jgi:dihydrofolate reductase
MDSAGAMLFGRRTYELMEDAWPQVARARPEGDTIESGLGEEARSQAQVRGLDDAPRFPVEQHASVEGDLTRAVKALKKATPRGLLVGSPKLSAALQRLDLVDEYRFVVHPVVAGHGPFLFSGLQGSLRLKFVAATLCRRGRPTFLLSYLNSVPYLRANRVRCCRQVG